jgi:dienelactone hydrolase
MGRVPLLILIAVAGYILWQPLLYPGGKAALVLLDVYSEPLAGVNVAKLLTPEPRAWETREAIGGVEMRVSWWRPGWGERHPAIMVVNGATPLGNDNAATRAFAATLARAGYLVMLPEFPFSTEGRLDPDAPRVVDAAFARLRALAETAGLRAGAFGASTGAALMLCAAGSHPALGRADHLTVLGGYFDLDTYVAAVAARSTGDTAWEPSAEARERIPPAVEAAMRSDEDRAKVRRAFAAATYRDALEALASLSPQGRDLFDRLSPSTAWSAVAPPVFWIHDPQDTYEPLAEAQAAQAAPRPGRFALIVPRLVQHAEVGQATKGQDPLTLLRELWGLLAFTLEVLRTAG